MQFNDCHGSQAQKNCTCVFETLIDQSHFVAPASHRKLPARLSRGVIRRSAVVLCRTSDLPLWCGGTAARFFPLWLHDSCLERRLTDAIIKTMPDPLQELSNEYGHREIDS